jgi:succinate dehydrogenase hydrophobic anchor subunit
LGLGGAVSVFLVVMVLATNLPWVTRRILFLFEPAQGGAKGPWWRVLEWVLLFGVVLAMGWGLEYRVTANVHPQGGVFYTVLASVYAAFALPGLLYYFERRPKGKAG